eukprot:CCRYP_008548-RA/>CCRYP_008548-RA protein AED:0.23 eAED:0.23 QI:106/1/1/1/0/0/2/147/84
MYSVKAVWERKAESSPSACRFQNKKRSHRHRDPHGWVGKATEKECLGGRTPKWETGVVGSRVMVSEDSRVETGVVGRRLKTHLP